MRRNSHLPASPRRLSVAFFRRRHSGFALLRHRGKPSPDTRVVRPDILAKLAVWPLRDTHRTFDRDVEMSIRPTSPSLVTAPSHRSRDLLLKATRGVTIALVSSRERKRRQPGLATDRPEFVGWHQLV